MWLVSVSGFFHESHISTVLYKQQIALSSIRVFNYLFGELIKGFFLSFFETTSRYIAHAGGALTM